MLGTKLTSFIPFAFAAFAIGVLFTAEALRRADRAEIGQINESHARTRDAEQVLGGSSSRPFYEEQGKRVYDLGRVQLRIPITENPASWGEWPRDLTVQLTICWHAPGQQQRECPSFDSVIVIFLLGRTEPAKQFSDGIADLRQHLPYSDGPYETAINGVWEFRYKRTGDVFNYALSEPDFTGRHALARCYGLRCRVSIPVRPYLIARYTFDRSLMESWPQIDQQVRKYISSFVVEH